MLRWMSTTQRKMTTKTTNSTKTTSERTVDTFQDGRRDFVDNDMVAVDDDNDDVIENTKTIEQQQQQRHCCVDDGITDDPLAAIDPNFDSQKIYAVSR